MIDERYKIVIVDDDPTNLMIGKNALMSTHDVYTISSGEKLFQLFEKLIPDLILLDVDMPGMSGYDVIEILKKTDKTADIPVIFLTAAIDPVSEVKGLSLGAVDYITKPFSKELLLKRIEVHMLAETQRKKLKEYNHDLEVIVDKKTETVFGLQNAILKTVAELVESRDNITGGHIERTQLYLSLFVGFLLERGVYTKELSSWDIGLFAMSSQLHDVGKISIRDSILMKPGKLTDDEFEEMKKHTIYGMNIVDRIERSTPESAFLRHARIMAVSHHEKWDGTGYPFGLSGRNIPLQGRLMAIIDVYDALTNDRPYKNAFTHEEAMEIIQSGNGTSFDPMLCDVFIEHEKEFCNVKNDSAAYRLQPNNDIGLLPATQAVAAILDIREGMENSDSSRIRQYMTIFTDALLEHERFKDEVSSWDVDIFLLSAQLHDIGKIAVSDSILNKADKLTDEEYANVKSHSEAGVRIVQQMQDDMVEVGLLDHAEALAGSHHEKWDGSGYPLGLSGKDIPLQGRLMAIVDVYDALTHDRPNRGKLSHQKAVDTIMACGGSFFDPELVGVFAMIENEFERVGAE